MRYRVDGSDTLTALNVSETLIGVVGVRGIVFLRFSCLLPNFSPSLLHLFRNRIRSGQEHVSRETGNARANFRYLYGERGHN